MNRTELLLYHKTNNQALGEEEVTKGAPLSFMLACIEFMVLIDFFCNEYCHYNVGSHSKLDRRVQIRAVP